MFRRHATTMLAVFPLLTLAMLASACSDSTAPTGTDGSAAAAPGTQTAGGGATPAVVFSQLSTLPGDFSPFVPPQTRRFDDCRVEIGPVFDNIAYPNYRKIGGVRLNCNSVHRFVDATVAIGYWNGWTWVQYGQSSYGIRYNSYGSGTGLLGILRTSPVCFGTNNRGYYWSVHATVRTERVTTVMASDWALDGSGC